MLRIKVAFIHVTFFLMCYKSFNCHLLLLMMLFIDRGRFAAKMFVLLYKELFLPKGKFVFLRPLYFLPSLLQYYATCLVLL